MTQKSTSVIFNSLIGDLNAGAKRLATQPILVEQIPDDLLGELLTKFEKYNPMTIPGKENKAQTLVNIQARINQLQEVKSEKVQPVAEQPFIAVEQAEKVIQNTVVLEIHFRQMSFSKSLGKEKFEEALESNTVPKQVALYQNMIDKKHLKGLQGAKSSIIGWLKSKAMPSNFLANGMYLIPLSLIGIIDEKINEYKAELEVLLADFEVQYPNIIEESKADLGKLFNEAHYPPFNVIRESYKVEARYLTLNVPAALEKVNRDLFEKQKAESQQMWADATQEIRDALREGFKGLVGHFVDKMGKDADGKRKTFQGSTVEKLKEFVTTFQDKNLTNDDELAKLANDAKLLLENVDPKNLRKDEGARDQIENQFKQIKEMADNLVVTRTRKVNLED